MATITFRKVRSEQSSCDDAIKVTLFRDGAGRVCAWYLGPVRLENQSAVLSYLARSECVRASVAIVRALAESMRVGTPLCIVDPEDLWEPAWTVA